MLKRIGSMFKKSENDWLKVTISIFFSIIMIIFLGKTVVSSYAIPNTLPDTLTSGMGDNSERINLFDELYGDELLYLVPYYATSGGTRYTVYCLDKEKEWAPNHTITKDNAPLDAGYVYLIQNGYPAKSLTGNDAYDDYLTQIAVWWYQDLYEGTSNLTSNQKNVIQSSSYYRYIEPLINGAVNASNNPVVINPSFSINSSDFNLSSDNRYLITDTITVNSNVNFDSYTVSVNNSAVEILDSNNSVVSGTINSGSGFKLRVSLAEISNPITVNISVTVNYTEYEAYSYTPDDDLMQNALPAALVPVSKQKTISSNVTMPTGSLTIKKVDSEYNSPLAGASIEVIRKATNKSVANFITTTEDYLIDNLLPGEYEIKEVKAPNGYYIDKESTNVVISDSNLNVSSTITNSKYEVRVRKVDRETGKVVSGAVLNIINSNNEVVDTITTTDDYVSVDTTKLSEGTYKVVEVSAPSGYFVSNEEKEFTLDKNHTSITVDFEDEKNEVLIEKKDASNNNFVSGAVLRLVRVSDNSIIDEWTTNNKAHSIKGLGPGEYNVIEVKAPNGYTLSSSEVPVTITGEEEEAKTVTFYNSNNQVVINKVDEEGNPLSGAKLRVTNSIGDEIETFTTTKEAYTLDKLSPGTYYVEEIEAPSGYALNKERESFTIDENTTSIQVTMKNVKSFINIGKVDADTEEYVADATLRLTNSNGDEVETFTSSNVPTEINVPYGKYKLEEVKAPDGYVRTSEVLEIDFNANSDSTFVYKLSNKKRKVTVTKIDSESKEPILGSILGLYNNNKEYIRDIDLTDVSSIDLSTLEVGTYYIKEKQAPDGYILDESFHELVIEDTTEEINLEIENKPIIVNLGKIDARNGEYIAGARMRLTKENGDFDSIEFISTNEPYQVRLSAGIYILEELEAPAGYVGTGSKITFEVLETGKVQTVNISNDVTTVSVNDRKLVVDAEEGYKYSLETRTGEVVDEFETTKDGYISDTLELGDYVLKQLDTPDGVIVNNSPIYFSVTDDSNVSIINYVNDFTKINISKLDMANSVEVEGAHLVIRDSNGNIVEEWISSNTPHYIEKLPVGRYTLKETIAPDGYVLNTSVIDFEVLETGDIQSGVMFNSKPIEVPNTGSNATYIYLIGGLLSIIGGTLVYISYRNKNNKKSIKNI